MRRFHTSAKLTALFVALLVLAFPAYLLACHLAERILRAELGKACPGCRFHWDSFALGWRSVRLGGVNFSVGDPNETEVSGRARSLRVDIAGFRPRSLRISGVSLDEPSVRVTEGDEHPAEKPPGGSDSPGTFSCDEIRITRGTFTYVRRKKDGPAEIHVRDIEGQADRWSSAEPGQWTTANATGLLERTGRFRLTIQAPLFAPKPAGKVRLEMAHLRLGDLNPFFVVEEGLELEGLLKSGVGIFSYQDRAGESRVAAAYQGLKVRFHSYEGRRSGLTAFFSTLISSAEIQESKSPAEEIAQTAHIRRQDESIVSFVLRGYRDAAMKVASRKSAAPRKMASRLL